MASKQSLTRTDLDHERTLGLRARGLLRFILVITVNFQQDDLTQFIMAEF